MIKLHFTSIACLAALSVLEPTTAPAHDTTRSERSGHREPGAESAESHHHGHGRGDGNERGQHTGHGKRGADKHEAVDPDDADVPESLPHQQDTKQPDARGEGRDDRNSEHSKPALDRRDTEHA